MKLYCLIIIQSTKPWGCNSFVEKTSKTSVTQGRCCCTLAIEKYHIACRSDILSVCVSVCLSVQVNCNGFTIEDEELSHLGSAVFPE